MFSLTKENTFVSIRPVTTWTDTKNVNHRSINWKKRSCYMKCSSFDFISFYDSGQIHAKYWDISSKKCRTHGPYLLCYDKDGNLEKMAWCIRKTENISGYYTLEDGKIQKTFLTNSY